MGWTSTTSLALGDVITIERVYRRRTFWEWLTRKPRELEVFEIRQLI